MVKAIEISTAVFAAIWASRRDGEETENEILSRLLAVSEETAVKASNKPKKGKSKMRWIDDVVAAMKQLGGRAAYSDLYEEVRRIRLAAGRTLPLSTEAIIRREVENHAAESQAFTNVADLFYAPHGIGAGIWALRE